MADAGVLFNKFRTYADRLGRAGAVMAEQVAAEGQRRARKNLETNRSIKTGDLWRSISVKPESDGSASVFVDTSMLRYDPRVPGWVENGTYRSRAKPFFRPMIRSLQTILGIRAAKAYREALDQ